MWFMHVKSDMGVIPDMIEYYLKELDAAQKETRILGSLEQQNQALPGQVSHRFNQLQDLESVLKFLNVRYDKMRSDHYRRYLERYNRELTDRSIEKYIDGEADIVGMLDVINEVALMRNKYLGIMKGFDVKSYSMGNITRLRIAGMNDAEL
jgi:hypothetical protein